MVPVVSLGSVQLCRCRSEAAMATCKPWEWLCSNKVNLQAEFGPQAIACWPLTEYIETSMELGPVVSGSYFSPYSLFTWKANGLQSHFSIFFFFFSSFCLFWGPLPQHMEVPRLGVESELLLPAHARALAGQDPRRICDLHHRSRQRWILNPLSKARNRTCNLMVPSRIR